MAVDSKFDLSRLTIRRAREEDYEGVCAIGDNIYDGFDYISGLYMEYLQDPKRLLMVGEVDGHIIAFNCFYMVDDGQSCLAQAGRLHPKYRSLGIWPHFRSHAFVMAVKQFPSIQYVSFTSESKEVHLQRARRTNINFILDRPQLLLGAWTQDKLYEYHLPSMASLNLNKLTGDEAVNFLDNKENQWKYFPYGRILSRWEPYRFLTSNYHEIFHQGAELLVTEDIQTAVTPPGAHYRAMSFLSQWPIQLGINPHVDFYGDSEEDAMDHILYMIQYFCDRHSDDVFYPTCSLQVDMNIEYIQSRLLSEYNIDSTRNVWGLFESPLEQPLIRPEVQAKL